MITTLQKPMYAFSLTALLAALVGGVTLAQAQVTSGVITRELSIGSSGAEVSKLQTLLASDRNIYPAGLITGYYGPLTASAVAQFQLAYGLPPVGNVGPLTLAKINSILAQPSPSIDIYAPGMGTVLVTAQNTTAALTWSTNESARGKVYFDVVPLVVTEAGQPMAEPSITGMSVVESNFTTSHTLPLSALQPGRTYYYVAESVDAAGNVSLSVPATFTTTQ